MSNDLPWQNEELRKQVSKERYLGDGVYASFDGYRVWLAVNHHDDKVVALEPNVWLALCDYINDLEGK